MNHEHDWRIETMAYVCTVCGDWRTCDESVRGVEPYTESRTERPHTCDCGGQLIRYQVVDE